MLGLLSLGIISFAVGVPDADLAILLDLLACAALFLAFGLAQDYGMSKMTLREQGAERATTCLTACLLEFWRHVEVVNSMTPFRRRIPA